jgi:hypothetical protein
MKNKLPIEHIGNVLALCSPHISANLREDLGYERYKKLGVSELFRNEEPYRICKRCLRVVRNCRVFQSPRRRSRYA